MAVDMYPDPERRRNRGFLGSDSSALSAREKQASQSNAHPLIHCSARGRRRKRPHEHRLTLTALGAVSQERQQLRYELDLNSWNLRIWGVAASGFLTDSFVSSCLFC